MRVVLKKNECEALDVESFQGYLLDQKRQGLKFAFGPEMALTDLDVIFSEENCETIVVEKNGDENLYSGYVIRGELSRRTVPGIDEFGRGFLAEKIFLTLYQRSYEEERITAALNALESQEAINAEQDEALMELCEMMMG